MEKRVVNLKEPTLCKNACVFVFYCLNTPSYHLPMFMVLHWSSHHFLILVVFFVTLDFFFSPSFFWSIKNKGVL